jgi:hypothetical protein
MTLLACYFDTELFGFFSDLFRFKFGSLGVNSIIDTMSLKKSNNGSSSDTDVDVLWNRSLLSINMAVEPLTIVLSWSGPRRLSRPGDDSEQFRSAPRSLRTALRQSERVVKRPNGSVSRL